MRTRIIAEVAQGYEGRPDYAAFFVRAAAKARADAVKFQIVFADDTAEPGYQYYDFYKQLEMDVAVWQGLRNLAGDLGVGFFADVSGDRAMAVARTIRPDAIKIHSSNFFNRALIRQAFEVADRVFVSLGGVTVEEVDSLVDEVGKWGCGGRLGLLYGFQAEPTPTELTGLARLPVLRARFPGIALGYMDHAPGESEDQIHLSAMAMALGVDWIEKHLTLDRFMEVEDFVSALEPREFARYVDALDRLWTAMGDGSLALNERELAYRDRAVKKLIAARDLPQGTVVAADDLVFKRTPRIPAGQGFHDPGAVVGRRLAKALGAGEPFIDEVFA
ncbi:MAG: N-acetylneuraminate synthase family protein [Pseudomonadota bacterium]